METKDEFGSSQFLSFTLRGEHFAVEINKVREVLDVSALTRIPRMPDYLSGVINLRGAVVPVVDLGLKLGMDLIKNDVNTCIIIVEVSVEEQSEAVMMGVLTDGVQAVLDLHSEEIESVPKMGTGIDTDFIKGMGRDGDKFLILLDINRVLVAEGKAALQDLAGAEQVVATAPPESGEVMAASAG